MKRKIVFIGFVLLVAMALSGCGSSNGNSKSLVGKWESSSITEPAAFPKIDFRGYEFNEDGTLKVYNASDPVQVKEYTWSQNKDNKNIIDLNGAEGNSQMKYFFDQDWLHIGDASTSEMYIKHTGSFEKVDEFSFSDLIEPDSRQSDLTAEQIVMELKNKGLPIGEILVVTEENDSSHLIGAPNQYTSKAVFADTDFSQSTDPGATPIGGSVEVYANTEDATSKSMEYTSMEETSMEEKSMKETNTKDKSTSETSSNTRCSYRIGNILLTLDSVDFSDSGAITKVANYLDALLEINK